DDWRLWRRATKLRSRRRFLPRVRVHRRHDTKLQPNVRAAMDAAKAAVRRVMANARHPVRALLRAPSRRLEAAERRARDNVVGVVGPMARPAHAASPAVAVESDEF